MREEFKKIPNIKEIKKETKEKDNYLIYKPYTDKEILYIPMMTCDGDPFYMQISKEMIKEWLNEK